MRPCDLNFRRRRYCGKEIKTAVEGNFKKEIRDFLNFTVCEINDAEYNDEFIRSVDYDALWKISRRQKMSSLISFAVCKCPEIKEISGEGFYEKCEKHKMQQIRKAVLFDEERAEILSLLEEKGIWYLPLKGILLQKIYPEYGMREMVDNDILYDKTCADDLIRLMEGRGYEHKFLNGIPHDSFYKKPFFNFEFHRQLFTASREKEQEYYSDISRFLVKDEDNKFGYHFSDEDCYVYLICHAYKHYIDGEAGLRNLVDTYLFRKNTDLNMGYILEQLGSLGLDEFESKLRKCGDDLFSKGPAGLDGGETEFIQDLCQTVFYGGLSETGVSRKVLLNTNAATGLGKKAEYIFRRLFPKPSLMRELFPVLDTRPYLLPFIYIYKIARGLIKYPARKCKELRLILKSKG